MRPQFKPFFSEISGAESEQKIFLNNLPSIYENLLFLFGERYLKNNLAFLEAEMKKNGFLVIKETQNYINRIQNLKSDILDINAEKNVLTEFYKIERKNPNSISYVTLGETKYVQYPNKSLLIVLSLLISLILSFITVYFLYSLNRIIKKIK